jgi:3-methyladenine DNA glycosylase AlkD
MTLAEAMKTLESLGTEQTRKTYQRHGSGPNVFGVSFAEMGKLQKQIKKDHALACGLWKTGNTDARILATMIVDPAQLSEGDLDEWLSCAQNYGLVDLLVRNVVSKSSYLRSRMDHWIQSSEEYTAQAGWVCLAIMAMQENSLPDSYFEGHLKTIEAGVRSAPNRARYAMNSALIAIGTRNSKLEKLAIAAAKRIGKVEIDHGDTDCKTPDAVSYILKTRERKAKKASAT